MKWWLAQLCALVLSPTLVHALEQPENSAAYAKIDAERARETASFDAQEADCYQRFAANRCLKTVQTRRVAVMNALRKQETALHAADRRQLGAEALQRLDQKASSKVERDAQAQKDAAALAAEDRMQAQKEKQTEHAAQAASASAAAEHATSAPSAQAQAQNRERYASKLTDAEKRRLDIAKQRKDRTGKALPPLPTTD